MLSGTQWQRFDNRALIITFGLWYVAACFGSTIYGIFNLRLSANQLCCSGLLLFTAILGLTMKLFGPGGQRFSKTFPVERYVARQVIENILRNKGLPYHKSDTSFEINGTDLIIQVYGTSTGRYSTIRSSLIKLGPITPENTQLLYSLRHKIDEAFLPRGL